MLSRILRIAKWEISHQYDGVKFRHLLIIAVFVFASIGFFFIGGLDAEPEKNMYSVATAQGSPYADIIDNTPELKLSLISMEGFENRHHEFDVLIAPDGNTYYNEDREESMIALSILSESVLNHNREAALDKDLEEVAFPVNVNVDFEQQDGQTILEESVIDDTDQDTDDGSDESTDDNGSTDKSENNEDTSDVGDGDSEELDDLEEEQSIVTPRDIQPPLPLESIILAFLFLIPMNFIVQNYASSIFDERIDYSGELLLVTPSSRYQIIVGKTLPYLMAIVAISAIIALAIGASLISVIASSVIGLAFLSIGFITGVFVRSYRELTFVFLSLSIFIFAFVIVPSIFSSIHPIAIISPLTLVVMDLQSDPIGIIDLLFSLGPLTLTSLILFAYGASLYREEDMFTQRSGRRKLLDMFSGQTKNWKYMLIIGMSVVPFVFAFQLLFVALIFALPEGIALPAIFIIAALSEEIAKSLPIYASVVNSRLKDKYIYYGAAMSGLGFFLAEQVTTIGQLVGLTQFDVGSVVVSGVLSSPTFGSGILLILPVLWIAIHPVTTMISAYGAKRSRGMYIVFLIIATIVHVLYNAGVIMYVQ